MKTINLRLLLCLGFVTLASAEAGAEVADFELEEQNLTSPRIGQSVSPRDYRHQVTAWYFGAAT